MVALKVRKKISLNGEPDRLDEIFLTAAEIICEKGFDATSMNDIADAVGMTKAGIYHYIPGKKDLLYAIMNYAMDQLEAKVITPAKAIPDPVERLQAIIHLHAKLLTSGNREKGVGHMSILTDELAALTASHRRKIIERKRAYLDLVRTTLEQLKEQRLLKNIDATVGAFSLFGMIMWISRWYRPEGRLSTEQIAREITQIALHGLLKAPASHA